MVLVIVEAYQGLRRRLQPLRQWRRMRIHTVNRPILVGELQTRQPLNMIPPHEIFASQDIHRGTTVFGTITKSILPQPGAANPLSRLIPPVRQYCPQLCPRVTQTQIGVLPSIPGTTLPLQRGLLLLLRILIRIMLNCK